MPYVIALLVALTALPALGQGPGRPILDMHLHARHADYIGPNPTPMCTPFAVMPRWDNTLPPEEGLASDGPPCESPIPAATTDEQVLGETLAVMERFNIIGMVSGEPELMAVWKAAAPERILVGLDLRIGVDASHPPVAPRNLTNDSGDER